MLEMMIAHVALDHCNLSPNEVLDPITPEDMLAFGEPGGLLHGQDVKGHNAMAR